MADPSVTTPIDPIPTPTPITTPIPITTPTPTPTPTPTSTSTYKYYPAPPIIQSYYKYQDVNNDKNLQDTETRYFLDKTIYWIKNDKSFKSLKKLQKYFKGPDGYEIMYKLLKLFVKRGNTNWYDLEKQQNLVKDYIKHKLNKL
jgi:hypothetical protein